MRGRGVRLRGECGFGEVFMFMMDVFMIDGLMDMRCVDMNGYCTDAFLFVLSCVCLFML